MTDDAGQPVAIEARRPSAPDPVTLTADDSGAFGGELALRRAGGGSASSTDGS